MKLTQTQVFILAVLLLIGAFALFGLGHDAPAGLCLGAVLGLVTPTESIIGGTK